MKIEMFLATENLISSILFTNIFILCLLFIILDEF